MSDIETAPFFNSNKLYVKRARLILPYLVRMAKARQTVSYTALANYVGMPNARNLNYPLGEVGKVIKYLSAKHSVEIPHIELLVVSKNGGVPGVGAWGLIGSVGFKGLTRTQRQSTLDVILQAIYNYNGWDWVLNELALDPLIIDLDDELEKAKRIRGGGEGIQHKDFKLFISQNPSSVGLSPRVILEMIEYPLPSGDTIDLMFSQGALKIGIEVKSLISSVPDILRGLFQCVKYKYLIEAEQIVNNQQPNSRVILALQGSLPVELTLTKDILGIEVVENIR